MKRDAVGCLMGGIPESLGAISCLSVFGYATCLDGILRYIPCPEEPLKRKPKACITRD